VSAQTKRNPEVFQSFLLQAGTSFIGGYLVGDYLANRIGEALTRDGTVDKLPTSWYRIELKLRNTIKEAKKRGLVIVLEDLDRLWLKRSQQNKTLADKLSRFAYRKVQQAVITKAVEYGVPVYFIDPKNTSRVCPKCGAKLKEVLPRLYKCPKCGLLLDRDSAGAMNIWKRGGCGGAWVAPKRSPGEG